MRQQRTGAVVALKTWDHAKSRLADVPAPLRRRLAQTMAADTLAALAAVVRPVLVVSDEPSLQGWLATESITATVVPEPGGIGMNAALRHGDQLLRAEGIEVVLAAVADLPGLSPTAVRAVLDAAPAGRSFLADHSGHGTTLVIANGVPLDPRFEGASAVAHRDSGAHPLAAAWTDADARRDVDTVADLYAVGQLGPRTRALLDPATGRLGRHAVITTTGSASVITAEGYRLALPNGAVPGFRRLASGQRLHAAVSDHDVLTAWV